MNSLGALLEKYGTISLVGMAKNAGKTTTLNYLARCFAKKGIPLALTSIGRDGEELDVVTATKKPKIYVPGGSIIATAEGLLGLSDITCEIHNCTDISTPMGRVVVVRALSGGFVQLGGAPTAGQTLKIVEQFKKFNVGKILIDGAISRKNISNPKLAEAVVLCTGASLAKDMGRVVKKTRHAAEMLMLPRYSEERRANTSPLASETADVRDKPPVYLCGAVTDASINSLLQSGVEPTSRVFVAEDPSKVLISADVYEKLKQRGNELYVKTPVNLAAITVNPVSPKGFEFPKVDFFNKMSNAVQLPVFDVAVTK